MSIIEFKSDRQELRELLTNLQRLELRAGSSRFHYQDDVDGAIVSDTHFDKNKFLSTTQRNISDVNEFLISRIVILSLVNILGETKYHCNLLAIAFLRYNDFNVMYDEDGSVVIFTKVGKIKIQ